MQVSLSTAWQLFDDTHAMFNAEFSTPYTGSQAYQVYIKHNFFNTPALGLLCKGLSCVFWCCARWFGSAILGITAALEEVFSQPKGNRGWLGVHADITLHALRTCRIIPGSV